MSLRIQFELSERDLKHFKKIASSAKQLAKDAGEEEIIEAAEGLLQEVEDAKTPDFIHDRLMQLKYMIEMLQDEGWGLGGADRDRVLSALAYFCDPEDLIPDSTPGFGFLDDAIMVELMVRELKHEIEAYADFCNYRSREEKRTGKSGMARADWLDGKRKELHSRMRRRRKSERGGGGVRFKLL
ncbi:MAG: YkvA family protein [Gammaproteobacteria bacterium]|nr:YkvA family protein [Gammaproteobacteria bacterium]